MTTYRMVLQEEINGVFRDVVADVIESDEFRQNASKCIEKEVRDFIRKWNP